jgi:hypothetical protein
MVALALEQLISFNDEFATFFEDFASVENVDHLECVYDPTHRVVRLGESEPGGWVVLRNNQHTYLLIEIGGDKTKWNVYFAPDPKKVLAHLQQKASKPIWSTFLPLLRRAHEEAHPNSERDKPNLVYLSDLMTNVYLSADPIAAIDLVSKELK